MKESVRETAPGRLVETWFPFVEISRLVAADRRSKDPVYGVHRWFARRPPTLVRALLLASHLRADQGGNTFWERHAEPGAWLSDAVVYDPFMGGGTSLVESARMGATVLGRDVDPIAVAVVGIELLGSAEGFEVAADQLFTDLGSECGSLFAGPERAWAPLHWFWLMKPDCNECGQDGLLYKDLIVATSSGRTGSVVRDDEMHAFCPECLTVYPMDLSRTEIHCCGRRYKIRSGTYRQGRYRCGGCGAASTLEDLQVARAPRVLVAVEETRAGAHRRIRTATAFDRDQATRRPPGKTGTGVERHDFDVALEVERRDRRPVSAGFTTTRTLFTPRQWALFTSAFTRVRDAGHDPALERELTLMLTGALSSNNVLCGYGRDWGRLAPLFSVRGFSVPVLSVELNPFHPTAGRGTLRSACARMTKRSDAGVRRARLVPDSGANGQMQTQQHLLDLPVQPAAVDVVCRAADDTAGQQSPTATVCVTDPPYFDYIAYSELSEFFRVWLRDPSLGGVPLLPTAGRAVESFAIGLGAALKATLGRLDEHTPLVFTYHSAHRDAWTAIGDAFDIADLAVVALWPVLADPHMGHHAAAGNCEWDLVVVARRRAEVATPQDALESEGPRPGGGAANDRPQAWIAEIEAAAMKVGAADRASFEHAWEMSRPRFAESVAHHTTGSGTESPAVGSVRKRRGSSRPTTM